MQTGKLTSFDYSRNNSRVSIRKNTSFQGTSDIQKSIMKKLPHYKTIKRFESLKWLKGEMGGILITALGTGLVAPIFIGFNPFVKAPKNATPEEKEENKNTKLYTAMRQPISAVLAIIFQASVQKYIDKGLDKIFNNPEIAKYARFNLDQQDLNTESYIKSNITKKMKEEGKSKPSWIKALFSKDAKTQREAYQADFDARVEAEKDRQIKKVAEIFEDTGEMKAGTRHLDNEPLAKIVNKQIDTYIKKAKELQKTGDDLERYLRISEILHANQEHIQKILAGVEHKPEKEIIGTIKTLLDREPNTEVQEILKDILARGEDLKARRVNRTLKRIEYINKACGGREHFSRNAYKKYLIDRNGILEGKIVELISAKIKDPTKADKETIKQTIGKVISACTYQESEKSLEPLVLCATETFDSAKNEKSLTKKIYKDITKGYKKLVENNYKSWNQFTKIGVGVFITLPITCTALNWIYPRFMELFFPKLAGVKKDKGSEQEQQKVGGNK